MMKTNDRVKEFSFEGGLFEVFQKALELEANGQSIIHMEIGKPDFDSPKTAKEVVKKALDDGMVHYTATAGIEPLREAITNKYKRDYGLEYDSKTEIVVTAGACEAIGVTMLTLMNPGDEILVPGPYFPAYLDQTIIADVKLVEVPLKIENDFSLKVKDLESRITDKTKIILLNTPHNPTGAIIEKEDLEKIAKLAIEKDLIVISDETYDQFIFNGKHFSIASVKGMKERTIVINSASKTFSMTGWRIGYAMGPARIIKYLTKVHQNFSSCATSFAQVGAVAAYNNGEGFISEMLQEFKRRGELIYKRLSQIDGIKVLQPKGAFYIFPNIEALGIEENEFCKYILGEAGVAIVPGGSFGGYGKGFVRMCYACSYEEIEEAMDKMEKAIAKL